MSCSSRCAEWGASGAPNEPAASIRAERSSTPTNLVGHECGDQLVDRQRLEFPGIAEHLEDSRGLLRLEMPGDRLLELLHEHRHAFRTALAMADREIDVDTRRGCAVAEEHLDRVADVALVRRVVFLR